MPRSLTAARLPATRPISGDNGSGMPTYEYACTNCGNRFDVFQRIDEDPLRICDVCGGTLRKVFHPAGIVFKGSGFYATDSRKKTSSKPSGDGERTEKKSESTGEGKKEASKEKTA
jgi:putative FmdB family regulatory protein